MGLKHERAAGGGGGGASALPCATTEELLAELKRRSLSCMAVCVQVDETGDAWHYALKGSPILLGAMSAALSLRTHERLATETSTTETQRHRERQTMNDER